MTNCIYKIALALTLTATVAQAGDSVSYQLNGETHEGYFAAAETPRGTVVILHDWDGPSDYEMDRAMLLAQAGYNAFVGDLFGADQRPQTPEAMQQAVQRAFSDRRGLRARVHAAVSQARAQSGRAMPVYMIGYSFGAGAMMDFARSGEGDVAGIAAYGNFFGRLSDPAGAGFDLPMAPTFVALGGKDHIVPVSDVVPFSQAMERLDNRYHVELFSGAGHMFSIFGHPNYDAAADQDSWQAFLNFIATP